MQNFSKPRSSSTCQIGVGYDPGIVQEDLDFSVSFQPCNRIDRDPLCHKVSLILLRLPNVEVG